MMKREQVSERTKARVHGYMLSGFAAMFLLVGGIGGWAASTQISGAVIASGLVVVDSSVKKVQHPTGGIVGEIKVRDGAKVREGELLLRLDETLTHANLETVTKQLDELMVREARLKAERDGLAEVIVPAKLEARRREPAIAELVAAEQSLFATRRDSREGQKSQLRERVTQLKEEFRGIAGQITAKGKEIALIGKELDSLSGLEAQRLVLSAKMLALRRDTARLEGEHEQLKASAAQTKGKMTEIELQILRIDQEFRSQLLQELTENQSKQAGLVERRIAAEDQLRRIDIRAPQSGIVHQLNVHTVGGVINAGEPVMLIVPEGDKLVVDAKVAPHDIDQVLQSQQAFVRFAAFNQRRTPELEGLVHSVAADLTKDERSGEQFFTVRVEIPDVELARLDGKRLVPGMPAEVHIRTGDRTALSYLMKPIEDQFSKAFRER
ncbi:HlyD family type I secretion periplasmic adaptor subunit [Bradyrhizobium ontarionense]|uniref:Membrane fusion protein (MFP) family protein n=1 Tax=Bradyrhizobium ontarionense TaxID=2898149 RepID=A0ABY3R649_9BRAD|nr:HlyD family type I secretion periplasmic adaptor subunit [Bradyrhizobium sp. A19]UFZ02668.1 HlyD family type I secretion periplasmic adaptor subunit [Bradyrhizobium sp. A19]